MVQLVELDASRDPEDLARRIVEAGVAPAAAAGFARRDARGEWHLSVGASTPGVGAPIFDLASLTKPMTALAVARSGIARETPLGALLEEARGTPSEGATLELLLAHRAGLEAHLPLFAPLVDGARVDRREALVTAARGRRADAVGALPAEGFAPVYSDVGYLLAGEALARARGDVDPGAAIRALVVAPLGLEADLGAARDALPGFGARVQPTEVVAWRGGEIRGRVHDENAWAIGGDGACGHAGMFGTARAVLAFGAAALDAIARRAGPLAAGDLDWLVRERPGASLRAGFDGTAPEGSSAGATCGPRTFGHLGFTGTSVWIDPDAGVVVALLTNRVHPTRDNVAIRAARPRAHEALFAMAKAR